jgi:hypothetical protein
MSVTLCSHLISVYFSVQPHCVLFSTLNRICIALHLYFISQQANVQHQQLMTSAKSLTTDGAAQADVKNMLKLASLALEEVSARPGMVSRCK